MQRPEDELDDLRIHLANARRDCDFANVIVITRRIDFVLDQINARDRRGR